MVITHEEIEKAMFSIDDSKASGPDGFSSRFFKAAWSIIGSDVSEAVVSFFSSGSLLREINCTIIAVSDPWVVFLCPGCGLWFSWLLWFVLFFACPGLWVSVPWAFVHCSSGDFCSGCCPLSMFFRGGAVRFSFFVFCFSFFERALWVDFLIRPDI